MTDTNDSKPTTIKHIDTNETYVFTLKLYSKGNGEEVATSSEVSHVLDDEFEGEIPASYGVAREILMSLRRNAVLYAATQADTDFLTDPNISEEEKVSRILESSKAQEEALNATIN